MPRTPAHILDGLRPGMAQRLADGLRVLLNSRSGFMPVSGTVAREKAPSPAAQAVNAGLTGSPLGDHFPAKGGNGAPLSNLTAEGSGHPANAPAGRAPLSEPGTLSRGASRLPFSRAVEAVRPPAGRRLCESPAPHSGADA